MYVVREMYVGLSERCGNPEDDFRNAQLYKNKIEKLKPITMQQYEYTNKIYYDHFVLPFTICLLYTSRDWLIKIQYITINIDTLRALTCRIRLNVLCPCASRTILKQVQHVKTVFGKNYHPHANNLITLILDIDLKKRSIIALQIY